MPTEKSVVEVVSNKIISNGSLKKTFDVNGPGLEPDVENIREIDLNF